MGHVSCGVLSKPFFLWSGRDFLFVFILREWDTTVVNWQMCRSTQTLHLTVSSRAQQSLTRTRVGNRHHAHPSHKHARRLASFHRGPQLPKAADQHYLASKHETTWINRERQQRIITPERKSNREQQRKKAAPTSSEKQNHRATESETQQRSDSRQQQIHQKTNSTKQERKAKKSNEDQRQYGSNNVFLFMSCVW